MNRRLLTVLLVAFFIAAICTFLVYRLVSSRVAGAQPVPTTSVVAAKADIKLGTILTADNLTTIGLTGIVPKGVILEKDKSNVLGRGVISDLYAGEPILDNRLAAPGSGGGLAPKIPLGMRACAVRVDDAADVSGFVTPDMRVDVLISGTPPGVTNPTEGTVARTLLQNIQVLSAGTEYQKDAEGKAKQVGVVNLLVTPEQAESLSLATNQTKIQLVLRNPLDTKISSVVGTATSSLYVNPNAPPVVKQVRRASAPKAKAAAPQAFSIEVINGSKQSQEKFASPGGHQ
jgi:pilus assembly protein CpaB